MLLSLTVAYLSFKPLYMCSWETCSLYTQVCRYFCETYCLVFECVCVSTVNSGWKWTSELRVSLHSYVNESSWGPTSLHIDKKAFLFQDLLHRFWPWGGGKSKLRYMDLSKSGEIYWRLLRKYVERYSPGCWEIIQLQRDRGVEGTEKKRGKKRWKL